MTDVTVTRTQVSDLLDQAETFFGGFDRAYDQSAEFRQLTAARGVDEAAYTRLTLIVTGAIKLRGTR